MQDCFKSFLGLFMTFLSHFHPEPNSPFVFKRGSWLGVGLTDLALPSVLPLFALLRGHQASLEGSLKVADLCLMQSSDP